VDAIKILVTFGADVNAPNSAGFTPVSVAARDGRVDAIKALVTFGADVNAPNSACHPPVFSAAMVGHADVIKVLFDLGADLNAIGKVGFPPVIVAARAGHTHVVKMLWKLGADMSPDLPSSASATAGTSALSPYSPETQDLIGMGLDTIASRTAAAFGHGDTLDFIQKAIGKMKLIGGCDFCGSSTMKLNKCSRCKNARYCSRDCQTKDYKKHKKDCIQSS
jgi:ankyrin repeat protein